MGRKYPVPCADPQATLSHEATSYRIDALALFFNRRTFAFLFLTIKSHVSSLKRNTRRSLDGEID
jgi:hypothetical protein